MKIIWSRDTWYSKTLAVLIGILVLGLGIYIGMRYQEQKDLDMQIPKINQSFY